MLQGEHSAILLTFIKLPYVIKTFVLSVFEWLFYTGFTFIFSFKYKNSEYDQEIPQSQTADNPMAPQGRATHNHHETQGRQTKQIKQLSLPYQDDCQTRMDIK